MKKRINYTQLKMSMVMLLLCITSWQTQGQIITTVAGNGTIGYSGDGGPATNAELYVPAGGVTLFGGYVYFADEYNHVIRKVSPSGIISKVAGDAVGAGSPIGSFSGDGGVATAAGLNSPSDIVFDTAGNLYIADEFNHRIRVVNTSGIISTFAGTGGGGWTGDGFAATAAQIGDPFGLTIDHAGNVLICDETNHVIRKINIVSGIITTIAGIGGPGYSGDGFAATAAALFNPRGIRVDALGNIDFCDHQNCRLRQINPLLPV